MKTAVLVFPGSNCDHDAYHALKHVVGVDAEFVWHKQSTLDASTPSSSPGASRTAITFARGDGEALSRDGCGAQIRGRRRTGHRDLQRLPNPARGGSLPGAMIVNDSLRFVCDYVHLRAGTDRTPFTRGIPEGTVLKIPVAHYQGNYYADERTLSFLEERGQVVFRYCDPEGNVTRGSNPNGSAWNIAGICNEGGNVLGMMPHPERCAKR